MIKNIQLKIVLIFFILGMFIIIGLGLFFTNSLEAINTVLNTAQITDVIVEEINNIKTVSMISLVLLGAISIIVGIFLSKTVVKPIDKLIKNAEKLTSKEKNAHVKNKNEIDNLADTFEEMTTKLQTNLSEISTQKKQMETILLHMSDGIIAFNMEGKVILINPAATRALSIMEEDTDFETIFKNVNIEINMEKIIYLEDWTSSEQKVKVKDREITFLDTPGHEAFTAMRARGAQITDIAILVVAANDGVKPQTIEAINHAKSAGIPIIVAINKIDLPDANIEKVKQELMAYELVPEEWGGDTIYVPISAKKGENIDQLLEMVLLEADVLELKANPHKQAKGAVIEARLDKSKGAIATMLVQRGTLDVGDTIVVGSSIGRIRAMKDDKGKSVKAAGPSTPVEIMGLTEVPEAGDTFYEVKNEKMAKHLIERRKRQAREKAINSATKVTLDNLFTQMEQGNLKVLNLIVKADVQGSVEAVKQAMEKLENEEVKVKVIHAAAGAVNQSDVTLAKVSNAIIIAFNVRPDNMAKEMAEKDEVEIKQYSIIYQAIEDVEAAMKGMLDPKYEEKVIGNAEVRQTFKISNVGTIAGCYVISGKVERNAGVRVIRENVVIHDGHLATLKRFKDDVKEVTKGFECGIQIENYNDIKEGDVIEVYIMEEIKR